MLMHILLGLLITVAVLGTIGTIAFFWLLAGFYDAIKSIWR